MEKGVRFIGNGQAPVHLYWEEILNDYIRTGKFDPTFMISHRVKIDEFEELYAAFDPSLGGALEATNQKQRVVTFPLTAYLNFVQRLDGQGSLSAGTHPSQTGKLQ
jgi:hypothetical protein